MAALSFRAGVGAHLWVSWQVINRSTTELPLTVSYDKISLGRLRFWIHMQDAVYSLQQFGGCLWVLGCTGPSWGVGNGSYACPLSVEDSLAPSAGLQRRLVPAAVPRPVSLLPDLPDLLPF